jgi:hypothetical protein
LATCLPKIKDHLLNHLGIPYPLEVVVDLLGEEDLYVVIVDSLEGEGLPREEMYLQQDLGWDLHGTHSIQYLLLLPQPQKPLLPKSLYHTPSTFLEWTFMLKFLGKSFKLMERRKNLHSELFLFHFEGCNFKIGEKFMQFHDFAILTSWM